MALKVKVIVDVKDQDQEIVRIVVHVVKDHRRDIVRDHVIVRGNEIVNVNVNAVMAVTAGITTMRIIIVKVVELEQVVVVRVEEVEVAVIITLQLKHVKDHVHVKEIVQQLQNIIGMRGESSFFFFFLLNFDSNLIRI